MLRRGAVRLLTYPASDPLLHPPLSLHHRAIEHVATGLAQLRFAPEDTALASILLDEIARTAPRMSARGLSRVLFCVAALKLAAPDRATCVYGRLNCERLLRLAAEDFGRRGAEEWRGERVRSTAACQLARVLSTSCACVCSGRGMAIPSAACFGCT